VGKGLCGQSLEWWLYANIMTLAVQSLISLCLIDGREATHAVAECIFHGEESTTGTLAGDIRRLLVISEAQGITKITLVKGEPMFF